MGKSVAKRPGWLAEGGGPPTAQRAQSRHRAPHPLHRPPRQDPGQVGVVQAPGRGEVLRGVGVQGSSAAKEPVALKPEAGLVGGMVDRA